MVTSDLCEKCKLYPKDTTHALYRCPKLEIFGKTTLYGVTTPSDKSTSFLHIMFIVCAENRDPKLFSSMAWTLWNRRNNLKLGKPSIPLEQLPDRASELTLGCLLGPILASAVRTGSSNVDSPTFTWIQDQFQRSNFWTRKKSWFGSCYSKPWWNGDGFTVWTYFAAIHSHYWSGNSRHTVGGGVRSRIGIW